MSVDGLRSAPDVVAVATELSTGSVLIYRTKRYMLNGRCKKIIKTKTRSSETHTKAEMDTLKN